MTVITILIITSLTHKAIKCDHHYCIIIMINIIIIFHDHHYLNPHKPLLVLSTVPTVNIVISITLLIII